MPSLTKTRRVQRRDGWWVVACTAAVALVVAGCSLYANLSFAVSNPAEYRFFPPFERNRNANQNLNAVKSTEYANIGRALSRGRGFADPHGRPTGPTAWMPPVLPTLLAGIFWLSGGDRDVAMLVMIWLQVLVLIGTGWLALALVRKKGPAVAALTATVFIVAVLNDFHLYFQRTDDVWLVMLTLDLLVAGLCWFEPLSTWPRTVAWGMFGGICFLCNPIVGFAWGLLGLPLGWRRDGPPSGTPQSSPAWRGLCITLAVAAVTLAPWTLRNYLVFGRLLPVKSNLAYELYQSQCLQPDGLLQRPTFEQHPGRPRTEGREFNALGEMAYLDRKWDQFRQAVSMHPGDFLDRVADRFLGVTLWYVPFDRSEETRRPWVFWLGRLSHPLPFLGFLILLFTAVWKPLDRVQWSVMGVYLLYLLPYIAISYYERYAVPLLGAKVLLVVWGLEHLGSFAVLSAAAVRSGQRRGAQTEAVRHPLRGPGPAIASESSHGYD